MIVNKLPTISAIIRFLLTATFNDAFRHRQAHSSYLLLVNSRSRHCHYLVKCRTCTRGFVIVGRVLEMFFLLSAQCLSSLSPYQQPISCFSSRCHQPELSRPKCTFYSPTRHRVIQIRAVLVITIMFSSHPFLPALSSFQQKSSPLLLSRE